MTAAWEQPGIERELRLALAMRGGVSLAVWIGGACAEIDELRRGDEPFWRELAEACGYTGITVDVLTGASAGGLNGVLFASAIRHGFPMRALEPIWRDVASLDDLRRTGAPWTSVLDGDAAFLDTVHERLANLVAQAPGAESGAPVDLRLSATLVEPVVTATVSPTDEPLTRRRSAAGFHFRHDPAGAAPRADLEDDPDALWRLAVAARATASFPVAFEAAVVRSSRAGSFADAAAATAAGRLVDCRGVFSESAGPPDVRSDRPHPDDFAVADGGIIDNIPIGRALDAVAAAPADGPTRRVVVYLHPTGPAPPPVDGSVSGRAGPLEGTTRPDPDRGVRAVVGGVIRARVQDESIDLDLAQLERFNASIRHGHLLRRATVERLPVVHDPTGRAVVSPSAAHWDGYVVQRAAADAANLRELLDDPLVALGEDPFPHHERGDDVWRAPLARWPRFERERLDTALSTVFADALVQAASGATSSDRILRVGLSALRRSIHRAIEWCRYLPAADDASVERLGATKRRLYDLRSSVTVLERTRRLGWVSLAGHHPPGAGEVDRWALDAVAAVDGLLRVPAAAAERLAEPDPSAAPYLVEASARLDALVSSGATPRPDPTHIDARLPIVAALTALVVELLDLVPAYGAAAGPDEVPDGLFPDEHPGALVDRVLRHGAGPVGTRLGTLEVLSLAEHLAGSTPTTPIDFYRISAATPTPLADQFTVLRDRSRAIGAARADGWTGRPDLLRPEVKLAGNELSNFAAFLDPRWRTNDWMWGRLDATSGLVNLLVDSARVVDEDGTETLPPTLCQLADLGPSATKDEVVRALTLRRQEQVATDCGVPAEARADYAVGVEDLTHPGNRSIRRAIVGSVGGAARVLRGELPRRWRWVARPIGWLAKAIAWFRLRPRGGLPPADRR